MTDGENTLFIKATCSEQKYKYNLTPGKRNNEI